MKSGSTITWIDLQPLGANFLHLFHSHVMWSLRIFGVISINSVILAVSHVVNRFSYNFDVQHLTIIKYNLY